MGGLALMWPSVLCILFWEEEVVACTVVLEWRLNSVGDYHYSQYHDGGWYGRYSVHCLGKWR